MNTNYTCALFGHRNVSNVNSIYESLLVELEKLIVYNNVHIFLFGSKSKFYDICHKAILTLKTKYTNIKLIAYTCKHEYAYLHQDKNAIENMLKNIVKTNTNVLTYDEVVDCSKTIYNGKNSYIYRNNLMIDHAKYCLVYYNNEYITINKHSGTKMALEYAINKNKTIIYV